MPADWSRLLSTRRAGESAAPATPAVASRSAFQRDQDRVLFSGPFRRLADKTQVFPLPYDDHVHSRLTHSLEVAAISRSLGTRVGRLVQAGYPERAGSADARDFGDCVAAACLAHDLGNPPFGHVGEDAIREYFAREQPLWPELTPRQRLDLTRFEGNAQTFRIVTRNERPTRGGGLQLTFATLGALVKYPCSSLAAAADSTVKAERKPGLLDGDVGEFALLAEELGLERLGPEKWQRHPLALLVEAADDIAYLLLDLEDGRRLKHVSEELFLDCLRPLCAASERCPDLSPNAGDYPWRLDRADILRAIAIDALIHDAAEAFLAAHDEILAGRFPSALDEVMRHRSDMAAIQNVCFERCYRARDVLKMELAGAEAIQGLLTIFVDALRDGASLRGKHMRMLYPKLFAPAPAHAQLLLLTDHISGMTDHYAVRLYRELRGMRYPGGRD